MWISICHRASFRQYLTRTAFQSAARLESWVAHIASAALLCALWYHMGGPLSEALTECPPQRGAPAAAAAAIAAACNSAANVGRKRRKKKMCRLKKSTNYISIGSDRIDSKSLIRQSFPSGRDTTTIAGSFNFSIYANSRPG